MTSNIKPGTRLYCGECDVAFQTAHDKEQHLRLHCVLCRLLCDSRDELLVHVTNSHPDERLGGAVLWELPAPKKNTDDDEEFTDDELDRMERATRSR